MESVGDRATLRDSKNTGRRLCARGVFVPEDYETRYETKLPT